MLDITNSRAHGDTVHACVLYRDNATPKKGFQAVNAIAFKIIYRRLQVFTTINVQILYTGDATIRAAEVGENVGPAIVVRNQ